MKKKVFGIISLLLFILVSCNKENSLLNEEVVNENNNAKLVQVTDPSIINGFCSKLSTVKSSNGIDFNTEHIYEIANTETSSRVFFVNEVNFDESNAINYGLANVMYADGKFGTPTIVETEMVDDYIRIIKYYDHHYNPIVTIKIDSNTEQIYVIDNQSNVKSGQDVADCIADVYTNHGWVSVWAWVQTAVIPETAIGIAAACIGKDLAN